MYSTRYVCLERQSPSPTPKCPYKTGLSKQWTTWTRPRQWPSHRHLLCPKSPIRRFQRFLPTFLNTSCFKYATRSSSLHSHRTPPFGHMQDRGSGRHQQEHLASRIYWLSPMGTSGCMPSVPTRFTDISELLPSQSRTCLLADGIYLGILCE